MPALNSETLKTMRRDADTIFRAALSAVHAEVLVEKSCTLDGNLLKVGTSSYDLDRYEHIYVIGAGKAAAHMAAGLERLLGDRITSGIISVKYGHTTPLKYIRINEAAHPIPDESGRKCAEKILRLAESAARNDLVVCLLSGGASALLPLPLSAITLGQKQETIQQLLACGADIEEINAIRKHLSAIKGGQLARAAAPASLLTLVISDVVGDDLEVIASGPTVEDTSRFSDCLRTIEKYHLADTLPEAVTTHIREGCRGNRPETPKAGELPESVAHIIGSNSSALQAAAEKADALGYRTLILSSMIEGETRGAAGFHAAIAREVSRSGNPVPPPACILSGGETTVHLVGDGLGGRNQEFAMVAAMQIDAEGKIVMLSGGTDGTDGPTDAAGAVVDSMTIRNAVSRGLNPESYLDANDTYHFFAQTGELLMTGPTGTNVMDLHIVLVKK